MTTKGLLLMVVAALPWGARSEPIASGEKCVVTGKLGRNIATATIRAKEWETKAYLGDDPHWEWAYGNTVTVVFDLALTIGKKSIPVPRSAFSDLLDVREADLVGEGARGAIVIKGGDGAASYEARIEFDGDRVRRRTVFKPSFFAGPVQETVYHQRVLRDVP